MCLNFAVCIILDFYKGPATLIVFKLTSKVIILFQSGRVLGTQMYWCLWIFTIKMFPKIQDIYSLKCENIYCLMILYALSLSQLVAALLGSGLSLISYESREYRKMKVQFISTIMRALSSMDLQCQRKTCI